MKTTKTVWASDCPEGSPLYFAGKTLQDETYLKFVHDLDNAGFELAWHGATMESSKRERTIEALEFFKREFGYYPVLHCNHGDNLENIYWGDKRYSNYLLRQLIRLIRRNASSFCGDDVSSPYFWGDLCKKHFRYVRNFTFSELNMLKVDPGMPYSIRQRPYVNNWFSTTDAPDVSRFAELLTQKNIDQLAAEGGVCIISTHLGKGFTTDGRVDSRVVDSLAYIASLNGWFVPASEMLDYLLTQQQNKVVTDSGQFGVELRHIIDHAWCRITNRI
jgi:hypothetical protein